MFDLILWVSELMLWVLELIPWVLALIPLCLVFFGTVWATLCGLGHEKITFFAALVRGIKNLGNVLNGVLHIVWHCRSSGYVQIQSTTLTSKSDAPSTSSPNSCVKLKIQLPGLNADLLSGQKKPCGI